MAWRDAARIAAAEARAAHAHQHTQQQQHQTTAALAQRHGLVEHQQFSPESIAHYNLHEAFATNHTAPNGETYQIHHQGSFEGPVFAVSGGGKYFTSERFHSFSAARARLARIGSR